MHQIALIFHYSIHPNKTLYFVSSKTNLKQYEIQQIINVTEFVTYIYMCHSDKVID